MPYGFYHVMHLVCIVAFVSAATLILKGDKDSKASKIVSGLTGLLILVSGMGLLAKAGFGFDAWVKGKLFIWLALTMLIPITAKRFPQAKGKVFKVVIGLLFVAVLPIE